MVRTFPRRMTDAERAEAESLRDSALVTSERPWPGVAGLFPLALLGFFGLVVGCAVGIALHDRLHLPRGVALAAMLLCTATGVGFGGAWAISDHLSGRSTALAEAERWSGVLEQGEVLVTRVAGAQDAVEMADLEDGPAFFVDLGGGQAMFVCSLDLAFVALPAAEGEQPAFPCHAFDLVRFPGDPDVRHVACYPPAFAPSRVVEWEDVEDGYIPEDGEVLAASLVTLEDDLRRIAKEQQRRRS